MLMMLPFEAPTIFETIHKSYFRMPRVVKDQRSKFENDDLFRQLSHESAVKYTGFKDRPMDERQSRFLQHCQEGHTEISVLQSGNQFTLMFNPPISPNYATESCDYKKEHGKVHLKSPFILNGVCVVWRGWIDIQRLEGFGCLEFDAEGAQIEDNMLLHDRMSQLDHKQQSCNNQHHLINNMNLNNHFHTSPIARLNNHPTMLESPIQTAMNHHQQQQHHLSPTHHLSNSSPQHQQSLTASQQQVNHQQQQPPPPPIGLNPCIGPPPPPGSGLLNHINHAPHAPQHQQPAPVSMADSALHYSNAIAAAAVYQAFSGQTHPQVAAAAALHGLNSSQAAALAAASSPLAASLAAVSNGQTNLSGVQGSPQQAGANVRFNMNTALNLCDVNSR